VKKVPFHRQKNRLAGLSCYQRIFKLSPFKLCAVSFAIMTKNITAIYYRKDSKQFSDDVQKKGKKMK
jgi:hypothetical protein